jgi:hypothetical protein
LSVVHASLFLKRIKSRIRNNISRNMGQLPIN